MPATQIFITAGTTWVVPSDWNNASNTIEVIGGGAGGNASNMTGGGAGGYAKSVNVALTPGATVSVQIGAGSAGSSNNAVSTTAGGDTFLCNDGSGTVITNPDVVCGAK